MISSISATKLKHKIADVLNDTYFNGTVTVVKKHGKPVAKIVPLEEKKNNRVLKKEAMQSTAGAFRGTELEDDSFWEDVLKKHSRKKDVVL